MWSCLKSANGICSWVIFCESVGIPVGVSYSLLVQSAFERKESHVHRLTDGYPNFAHPYS